MPDPLPPGPAPAPDGEVTGLRYPVETVVALLAERLAELTAEIRTLRAETVALRAELDRRHADGVASTMRDLVLRPVPAIGLPVGSVALLVGGLAWLVGPERAAAWVSGLLERWLPSAPTEVP